MRIKITIEAIRRVKQKRRVWNGEKKDYDILEEVVETTKEIYSQSISEEVLKDKNCQLFDVIKAFNGEK